MKISLICASRARAAKCFKAVSRWWSAAGLNGNLQVIISLDFDDETVGDYFDQFSNANFEHKVLVNENRSAVDAINWGGARSEGDIIVVMSDDFDCPENWAFSLVMKTEGKTDWIAKTPDGIQKWIITLPILDQVYYNRFGYIYHPDYLHLFCDTELTAVADLTMRKIELDIPFVHNHYSVGKSVKDEVSIRADATWKQGEKLFLERARRKFDLVNPPGKIASSDSLNWMMAKGIKL